LGQLISGSCIDGFNQVFFLITFLNSQTKEISEIKIDRLTLSTLYFIRESKLFLGLVFRIKFLKFSKKIVIQKKI